MFTYQFIQSGRPCQEEMAVYIAIWGAIPGEQGVFCWVWGLSWPIEISNQ